jgi:hypothetical protein
MVNLGKSFAESAFSKKFLRFISNFIFYVLNYTNTSLEMARIIKKHTY